MFVLVQVLAVEVARRAQPAPSRQKATVVSAHSARWYVRPRLRPGIGGLPLVACNTHVRQRLRSGEPFEFASRAQYSPLSGRFLAEAGVEHLDHSWASLVNASVAAMG